MHRILLCRIFDIRLWDPALGRIFWIPTEGRLSGQPTGLDVSLGRGIPVFVMKDFHW